MKAEDELRHLFETAWQDGFGCARDPNYNRRTDLLTEKAEALINKRILAELEELLDKTDTPTIKHPDTVRQFIFDRMMHYKSQEGVNNAQ